ncbi:MAG: autoinducer binding domain-containing protein [Hyphomonadaceae bacterium]|nr:autoinducer binding domain-containing protein [Hyphomonadaceae bacterium]
MMLAERMLAFAAQAPELQTRKALGASLMTFVETLGATRFSCVYLRREAGGLTIDKAISNVPRLWQELYLERGYDATDPVFRAVLRGGAYGFWSELTRGVTMDKAARDMMSAAREFDMKDGFTKRVSLDNGGTAVMMISGPELIQGDRTRAALRMISDIFANEGARMLKISEDGTGEAAQDGTRRDLSRTQLKVLLMRADGLSNKQVAQSMGRHEKTVECHVTEILRRLEARNMIDAIRIAQKLKLII